MKLLGKLRNRLKNKKGFTLVELIVVIVIIAILAALIVPSVMKYIDKARDQQLKADARSLYIAAQTAATQAYGDGTPSSTDVNVAYSFNQKEEGTGQADIIKSIVELGKTKDEYTVSFKLVNYDVTEFQYTSTTVNKSIHFDGKNWVSGEYKAPTP
ncbi:type IV pilus assembly protein PilA [Lachnospiraceae bacterium PF1-21]|uniref:prepilin-type N-terminal cleavage/methylation domain-containing protein n=1 Tax=Ohessyouella blattaphilus TaxID=2949333 RepID=UPI003E281A15